MLTVDDIRLAFDMDDGTTLEISENADGFDGLRYAMAHHFGIRDDWFLRVAMPPFATNLTILWTRSDSQELSQLPASPSPSGLRPDDFS